MFRPVSPFPPDLWFHQLSVFLKEFLSDQEFHLIPVHCLVRVSPEMQVFQIQKALPFHSALPHICLYGEADVRAIHDNLPAFSLLQRRSVLLPDPG